MIKKVIKHQETGLIVRFITVGLICSVVFYLIFTLLNHLSVQYQIASAVGYLSGSVTSYFLNKFWTFKSETPHTADKVFLFALVYVVALGVNLGVLTLLVSKYHMNKYIAQVFAIGFSAVFSYSGNRLLVFNKPQSVIAGNQ